MAAKACGVHVLGNKIAVALSHATFAWHCYQQREHVHPIILLAHVIAFEINVFAHTHNFRCQKFVHSEGSHVAIHSTACCVYKNMK